MDYPRRAGGDQIAPFLEYPIPEETRRIARPAAEQPPHALDGGHGERRHLRRLRLLVNLAIGAGAGWAADLALAREPHMPREGGAGLRTEIVFFVNNLTIVPFTLVWMVEGLYRTLREGDLR